MDQITNALEPCKQFAKDSMRLVKRCTKPDRKGNKIIVDLFFQLLSDFPEIVCNLLWLKLWLSILLRKCSNLCPDRKVIKLFDIFTSGFLFFPFLSSENPLAYYI